MLTLPDVFENVCNKRIEKYKRGPDHIASEPGLACQASLKKDNIRIVIDMIQMVEILIIDGLCHAIHRHVKAIINIGKTFTKTKNHHI